MSARHFQAEFLKQPGGGLWRCAGKAGCFDADIAHVSHFSHRSGEIVVHGLSQRVQLKRNWRSHIILQKMKIEKSRPAQRQRLAMILCLKGFVKARKTYT
jgi:hypothetical protein